MVLLAWHAVRIPIEGDVATSLAHARDVLHFQGLFLPDVERRIIDAAQDSGASPTLTWLYTNIHLPVLFGFMAAARLLAPARYPLVRSVFALSFVPAALVIALYPLAPPHWVPEFGLGIPPSDAALTSSTGALFHNTTAAAASQHFGFAVLVAATAIWLAPRSRTAWLAVAYPVLVFLVIVGTGNHYVVDCVVGTLTLALAAVVAWLVHRPAQPSTVDVPATGAASIAFGYALITWGFVSLDFTELGWHSVLPDAFVLAAGVAAVATPRLAGTEPLTETR
jgi:hypothetical protein